MSYPHSPGSLALEAPLLPGPAALGPGTPGHILSAHVVSPALWGFLSLLLITSSLLSPGTTVCPPCDNEMKSEAIIEHLCASEFGKESVPAASPRWWGSGVWKGEGAWDPGMRASCSLSRHLGRTRQCPGQQAGCTVCLEGTAPLPPEQEPGHQQGATAAPVSLPTLRVPVGSCSPCPEASEPLDVSVGAR